MIFGFWQLRRPQVSLLNLAALQFVSGEISSEPRECPRLEAPTV